MSNKELQVDNWVWGNEKIVWGYSPEHKYTFKILEPKKGRMGCLSLQYHNEKSESWLQIKGKSWILVSVKDKICSKILNVGEVQNLPTGTVHRLMGLTEDCQVAEPSTPEAHAADKSAPKDVVRLHCVQGRDCIEGKDENEKQLVLESIRITEEAIEAIEKGEEPKEYYPELLKELGNFMVS